MRMIGVGDFSNKGGTERITEKKTPAEMPPSVEVQEGIVNHTWVADQGQAIKPASEGRSRIRGPGIPPP